MQTQELNILEKLVEAQTLIDLCPVDKKHRPDLEKASNLLDEVLDELQPKPPGLCCIDVIEGACEG